MQRWAQQRTERYGPNRSRSYQEEVARIHRELYKKYLNDSDNHDGVVTHLEPHILEYEVKWALGSITSGWWWNSSWAISNPKRWCYESAALNRPANLENSGVATGLEKSAFIPISKKMNAKECSNYGTIALISHTSKVMFKILRGRLQQYVNRDLPDVQAAFRKGKGTRDQTMNIHWIIEKARQFQKNIYFCFIDYAKAFNCVNHNRWWEILQEMGIPDLPALPASWEICM